MISSAGTLGFSVSRPTDAEDSFELARRHLAAEARSRFELGYRAGLDTSQKLPQWSIESLAITYRWDVQKWANSFASTNVAVDMGRLPEEFRQDRNFIQALGDALGTYLSPYFDDAFTPDTAYVRGFSQAMRDLWTSVFEGTPAPDGSTEYEPGADERSFAQGGPVDAEGDQR